MGRTSHHHRHHHCHCRCHIRRFSRRRNNIDALALLALAFFIF